MQTLTGNAPNLREYTACLRAALEAAKEANQRLQFALDAVRHVTDDKTEFREDEPAKTPQARGPPVKSGPLTTAELAAALGITQGTIRRRLCDTGSYFGLVPVKLPSGRLLWPADSLEQLTGNGGAK